MLLITFSGLYALIFIYILVDSAKRGKEGASYFIFLIFYFLSTTISNVNLISLVTLLCFLAIYDRKKVN